MSRPDPAPSEEAWANWTGRINISGYSHQTGFEETSADQSELSKPLRAPHIASTSATASASGSTSASSSYSGEGSTLGKSFVSPQTPAPSRGISFGFLARDPSQSSSAAPVPSNQRPGFDAFRKRMRREVDSPPPREHSANDTWTQDAFLHGPSEAKGSPAPEETDMQTVGHLSVRCGGRVRYVGDAFWGLIKGHEELCDPFLSEDPELPENMPLPWIDSPGLANLLKSDRKSVV